MEKFPGIFPKKLGTKSIGQEKGRAIMRNSGQKKSPPSDGHVFTCIPSDLSQDE